MPVETRFFYLLRCLVLFADAALYNMCFITGVLSLYIVGLSHIPVFYRYHLSIAFFSSIISAGIVGLNFRVDNYNFENFYKPTWHCIILLLLCCQTALVFGSQTQFARLFFVIFYFIFTLGLLLSRFAGSALIISLTETYIVCKLVMVLRRYTGGQRFAKYLPQHNSIRLAGVPNSHSREVFLTHSVKNTVIKDPPGISANSVIEELYVVANAHSINELIEPIKEGKRSYIILKFVPDLSTLESEMKLDAIGEFTLLSARQDSLEGILNRFKKRLFDIVMNLAIIVFLFNKLYSFLALMMKNQSRGAVFFTQFKSVWNNRLPWGYKFKNNAVGKESCRRQARLQNKRIKHTGRLMRTTRLEGFPQFRNVLMGLCEHMRPGGLHMLSHTISKVNY